jgi:hypothetical protein
VKNPFSINPVALRELRQLVRSRVVTWSFATFPPILFGLTMLAVASEMKDFDAQEIAIRDGIGESPLAMASVITGIVACLGIPFYAAMKAILETNRGGPGLEFTTALTPADIVGGRLVSTGILSAATVATAMPFFIFSYLLRGIPLWQVFFIPFALFCFSLALFSLALVIACRPVAVAQRIVLTVILFFVMTIYIPVTISSITFGTYSSTRASDPMPVWAITLVMCVLLAALVVAVRAYCASQLAPRYVDADRPFRHVMFAFFLISSPLAVFFLAPWCITWTAIGGTLAITSSLNSREMPRAARANAPRGLLGRVVSLPFTTGAVPGMLFSAIIIAIAGGVFAAATSDYEEACVLWAVVGETTFPAVLLGAILRKRKCEEKRFRLVAGIFVAYIVAVSCLSFTAAVEAIDDELVWMVPCNYAGIVDRPMAHLALYGVLLLVSAAIVVVLSIGALRAYRRPES